MIKFTYVYEELPFEGDLVDLMAEVSVDPYDPSEWHFEEIELRKYNEHQDDWYVLKVIDQTDTVMRAVHRLFQQDYTLRFNLEDEIDDQFNWQGVRVQ